MPSLRSIPQCSTNLTTIFSWLAAALPLCCTMALVVAGSLLFSSKAWAQQISAHIDTRPAHISATFTEEDITIDGRLNEADWQEVDVASGFIQQRPDPDEAASQPTEVRVLYDDTHLYVGMRMYDDQPEDIAAQLGRRGSTDLYSDWAHVVIDSYGDYRTAFRFGVNAAGVKRDVLHYDDTSEDDSWEAVWEVGVMRDSLGWTAEFQIPFSQLRFRANDEELQWGINFIRDIARLDERSFWAPIPPNAGRFVSLFGRLDNLHDVPEPHRLEATPYALSQVDWGATQNADPFAANGDIGLKTGLDVSYGIGANLTLTGTVNPDFGQVEVDPAVVNLGAFETFFPERRPFFREGADIFQFDINLGDGGNESLFYTRRIGRAPQGRAPGEAVYTDMPGSSRILGAVKLSGRMRGGWSVGGLNALTSAQSARWVDESGDIHRSSVEPMTNYGVARIARDFRGGQSTIGGILTTVHRDLSADRLQFLPEQAYATGADVRHRFGDGNWEARGWLAGSHIRGGTEAIQQLQRAPGRYYQRPDANHLTFDPDRTSLTGAAGDLTVARVSGGNWRGGGIIHMRSPGFEVNDLGFQQNKDQLVGAIWLGRLSFESGRYLRRWNLFSNLYSGWTWGGERIFGGGNINGSLELTSGWGGNAGVESQPAALNPITTRGGPALRQQAASNMWVNAYTDRRRPVGVQLQVNGRRHHETGTGRIQIAPSLRIRPAPRFQFSVGPRWTRNVDPLQFVQHGHYDGGTDYLFGHIEQSTLSVDVRMNVAFTPDLSFELYAQPFTSLGQYSDFRRVAEPRASDFDEQFHTFAWGTELREIDSASDRPVYGVFQEDSATEPAYTFADPGFHTRSLRGNAVLRWEYRPGSTLFVVWQIDQFLSAHDGSVPFSPFQDYGRMMDMPTEQTFLVKLTRWFGR